MKTEVELTENHDSSRAESSTNTVPNVKGLTDYGRVKFFVEIINS